MKLYNTISKESEEIILYDKNKVLKLDQSGVFDSRDGITMSLCRREYVLY